MTMRRGACPTLLEPMPTGDGLLVRFAPAPGRLTPWRLKAIGEAAERHGNGLVEITARGKLQVRGLTAESAPLLAARIVELDLGVADGLHAETGALAGLAADALADPLPLAARLDGLLAEAGIAGKLGPKVSVTVDDGGSLHLAEIGADLKIEAVSGGRWRIGIGGNSAGARWLGEADEEGVLRTALALLSLLAGKGAFARAQHLGAEELAGAAGGLSPTVPPAPRAHPSPVGVFALCGGGAAHGFALSFGQARGADLVRFAAAAAPARELRLAPGGGLLTVGLPEERLPALRAAAEALGLIADPLDIRLSIVACAGAPSCAAAFFDAKAVGRDLAHSGLLDGSFRVHLSACPKLCAQPAGGKVTLIGHGNRSTLTSDRAMPDETLRGFLAERAETHRTTPRRKKS